MTEDEQRAAVIKEAREWIGTPYHHLGRIKGIKGGCDCITFLAGVFENAGMIERPEIPYYAMQWHLNQKEELYFAGLLEYAKEIPEPKPGCIALWKIGHTFSHGAIVIEWPLVIHSFIKSGVVECDVDTAIGLKFIGERCPEQGKLRPVKFFDLWEAKK